MASFGENLRALRKSRGYSQEAFARILGTNQVVISSWEKGTRTPYLQTIKGIADTFKVPLSSLISVQDTGLEEDADQEILDALRSNPKIRTLFDRSRYLSSSDLDAVLGVVNAITKERGQND